MDAGDMDGDLAQVLITEEEIASRLDAMAAQIEADYADKDVLLVGVLKGAVYVMADLSRRLHRSVPMDWIVRERLCTYLMNRRRDCTLRMSINSYRFWTNSLTQGIPWLL